VRVPQTGAVFLPLAAFRAAETRCAGSIAGDLATGDYSSTSHQNSLILL